MSSKVELSTLAPPTDTVGGRLQCWPPCQKKIASQEVYLEQVTGDKSLPQRKNENPPSHAPFPAKNDIFPRDVASCFLPWIVNFELAGRRLPEVGAYNIYFVERVGCLRAGCCGASVRSSRTPSNAREATQPAIHFLSAAPIEHHPQAMYQRAGRLAVVPAGGAAAAFSSSFLLGRYTSTTTNHQLGQAATQQLSAVAQKTITAYARAGCQRRFASSIPKEIDGASSSTKGAAAKHGGKGFVEWYEGHLNSRPVTTKAITGSILWGVGDVVAQVVPTYFEDDASEDGRADAKKKFKYDVPRTARAVIFGFAIHAPLSHLHFNFLEWMTVRGGFQGLSIPVFKTIMEQVR